MDYNLEMKEDTVFEDPVKFQLNLMAFFNEEEHMKEFYEAMKEKLRFYKDIEEKSKKRMGDLREQLAALEHEQWVHWHKYFLSVCGGQEYESEKDPFVVIKIPMEDYQRWLRQCRTPYDELSEKEKGSDREWADKVLGILKENSVKALFTIKSEES